MKGQRAGKEDIFCFWTRTQRAHKKPTRAQCPWVDRPNTGLYNQPLIQKGITGTIQNTHTKSNCGTRSPPGFRNGEVLTMHFTI